MRIGWITTGVSCKQRLPKNDNALQLLPSVLDRCVEDMTQLCRAHRMHMDHLSNTASNNSVQAWNSWKWRTSTNFYSTFKLASQQHCQNRHILTESEQAKKCSTVEHWEKATLAKLEENRRLPNWLSKAVDRSRPPRMIQEPHPLSRANSPLSPIRSTTVLNNCLTNVPSLWVLSNPSELGKRKEIFGINLSEFHLR